jgi:hypothetical protein
LGVTLQLKVLVLPLQLLLDKQHKYLKGKN